MARSAGIPDSTVGGYFSGRHLPPVKPVSLLTDILRACGVTSDDELSQWRQVLGQVRRSPGRRPSDAPVPYRGLESFQAEHAQWFHGRETLTRVLVDRVARQHLDNGPVVVVGPSGSGKSSLLRAGLIPAFRAPVSPVPGIASWQVVLFTPGAHPTTELAARMAAVPADGGLLIVVDQFEELFILCADREERAAFLTMLADVRRGPRATLVVLGLRADFYPQAAQCPDLVEALQHAQVVVGPMGPDELRSVIVEPARSAKLDIDDGLVELLLRLDVLTGAGNTVYSLAFSPDGRYLAAGSADNSVHLWDLRDPRSPVALAPLRGARDYVQAVAFSADGRTLAAGSADGSVHLWDLSLPEQPRRLPVLTGPDGKVFTVAFSPDGRMLAAGSADKHVYLWDVSAREAPEPVGGPFGGSTSWINAVAFSPDGRTLAAGGSDATVRLWDLATRRTSLELPHPAPVTALVYAHDGSTLATGASDGVARLWTVPGPVITDSSDTIFNALFGPDGRTLVTGSGVADGHFRTWDISDTQRPRQLGPPRSNPVAANRSVGSVALSPDGETVAVGGLDGRVQLWDTRDPMHAKPLGAPLGGPTAQSQYVTFSPDGRLLAAGGDENTVWLSDVTDRARPGRPIPIIGPRNYVYTLAFSPDGHTLAAGSVDTTVWLWDIRDPSAPRHLATLSGPANYVYSVAFSPDGRTLAAGSADKTVRFWDVTDRARPTRLGPVLTGPSNYVFNIAFHPDGNTLAASTADRTIWLWDVTDFRDPTHLATLTAPDGGVNSVMFSPDGRVLAGSGNDRTARLWITDPRRAIDHVCAISGDPITPAEWSQYVKGAPYRPVCPR